MDAQELVRKLQIVLGTKIATGQIILTLRESRVESWEMRTGARLTPRGEIAKKAVDDVAELAHTTP